MRTIASIRIVYCHLPSRLLVEWSICLNSKYDDGCTVFFILLSHWIIRERGYFPRFLLTYLNKIFMSNTMNHKLFDIYSYVFRHIIPKCQVSVTGCPKLGTFDQVSPKIEHFCEVFIKYKL